MVLLAAAFSLGARAQEPSVEAIIQKSVEANQFDYKESPFFNYKETDKSAKGTRTYQITMIDGTPYQHLLEVNGEPLPPDQAQRELKKQQQAKMKRDSESASEKRARIAAWGKSRRSDNQMMEQLTNAFNFKIVGEEKVREFNVWQLKATPRPGYQPPNRNSQVLTGMKGKLWIDEKTYQWVKVSAQVIHPVSIEGFLAQVEPGTRFELEKSPVEGGSWQITHFSMKAQAKVLYLFSHNSGAESTYFDFKRIDNQNQESARNSVP